MLSSGYGVWIEWRHHHAVHDTDVSVPPACHAADARQPHARLRAERPDASRDRADAHRRPRTGCVHRGRSARLGLRPAVERVGAARADANTSSRSRTSDRSSPTSASRTPTSISWRPTNWRSGAAAARDEPVLRHHPALILARDPTITRAQLMKPFPEVHDGQLLSQQRRHDALPGSRVQPSSAAVERPARIRSPIPVRS